MDGDYTLSSALTSSCGLVMHFCTKDVRVHRPL